MEKYLLLRDNRESGPYSLEGMNALQLKPSDLIREEGTGTAWLHPSQIETLKALIKQTPAPITAKRRVWTLAAVFIGLLICISIAKKMNSRLEEESLSAKIRTIATLIKKEKAKGESFEHALVREAVPPVSCVRKSFSKPADPKEVFKQIKVKGNDYTVRYFGGISGLKLTVSNVSTHFVNKTEVAVEYLSTKGDVLETDIYPVRALHPHSSQTLSVPPSMEGVKARWKVLNIYLHQKQLLKDI